MRGLTDGTDKPARPAADPDSPRRHTAGSIDEHISAITPTRVGGVGEPRLTALKHTPVHSRRGNAEFI